MDNKLEYAGRIRGVGPVILQVRGTTHQYYTSSGPYSQKQRIEVLEIEQEEYKAQVATQQAVYGARLRMIESFMWESDGTSQFNDVPHTESPSCGPCEGEILSCESTR